MPRINQEDLLDVLVCDIEARPRNAPSIFDVKPHITRTERRTDAIVVEFDAAATDSVAAFVDAERLCCANLIWSLETAPHTTLTITATPAQLDVLAAMFADVTPDPDP